MFVVPPIDLYWKIFDLIIVSKLKITKRKMYLKVILLSANYFPKNSTLEIIFFILLPFNRNYLIYLSVFCNRRNKSFNQNITFQQDSSLQYSADTISKLGLRAVWWKLSGRKSSQFAAEIATFFSDSSSHPKVEAIQNLNFKLGIQT